MNHHPGLALMLSEMDHQCPDALKTLDSAAAPALRIVESLRRTGRLVLYGMGGSQHVNRIVEPLYRDLGIDAHTLNASQALMSPLPDFARTAIIASQSGESGEIVDLLQQPAGAEERFGLTLEPSSTLARSVETAIVAEGGTEQAFAATRSIVLTLAMHGAVLEALGSRQDELRDVLASRLPADIAAPAEALAGCDVFVFSGRHAMQGVAESGALSLMELARVPTVAFEGGQFRHGPFEALRPGLGVLLFRSAGPDGPGVEPLARAAADAGCRVVLFDAAGGAPIKDCTQVALGRRTGLGAALAMLLTLQPLNIALARRFLPAGIGTPQRTSKVTA